MVGMSANDRSRQPENSPVANIGAIVVIVSGFILVAIGKENQMVTVIISLAAGYLFGTHTNKMKR